MAANHSEKFRTEFPFTLPKGFLDAMGILHRNGVMRLATAADEILPMRDPRVQQNQAYLPIIVLARVIIKLGDLSHIDTSVVEGLFASDLDYLQRLYEELNGCEEPSRALADVSSALNGSQGATHRGFTAVGEH